MISNILQIFRIQSQFQKFFSITKQFFLTVGQNNFGNKIPFPVFHDTIDLSKYPIFQEERDRIQHMQKQLQMQSDQEKKEQDKFKNQNALLRQMQRYHPYIT